MEGTSTPPSPDCEYIGNGPNGPKTYGQEYTASCEEKKFCRNKENLLEEITVKCPGKKKCKDWTEPWVDIYRCPPRGPCTGPRGTAKVPIADVTGTSCQGCVTDNPCECPEGYT